MNSPRELVASSNYARLGQKLAATGPDIVQESGVSIEVWESFLPGVQILRRESYCRRIEAQRPR